MFLDTWIPRAWASSSAPNIGSNTKTAPCTPLSFKLSAYSCQQKYSMQRFKIHDRCNSTHLNNSITQFSFIIRRLYIKTITLDPGQIFEQTKTATDPPFVYTHTWNARWTSQIFRRQSVPIFDLIRRRLKFLTCTVPLLRGLVLTSEPCNSLHSLHGN